MKETGSASLKKSRPEVARRSALQSHVETAVKCDRVTIKVVRPSAAEVERNVAAGQMALSRAKDAFLKPGVRIRSGKNVPLFSVDPKNPSIIVRLLNGKRERGVLTIHGFEASR